MSDAEVLGSDATAVDPAAIRVERISPAIGAEIHGVDLAAPTAASIAAIRALLIRHKVLVFRDQRITPAEQVAFARAFGELEIHPVFKHHPDHSELVILGGGDARSGRENIFHTDVTWRARPSLGSVLRCVTCPPCGGDTIWTNMAAVYDALPEHIKAQIAGLTASHDIVPSFLDRTDRDGHASLRERFPAQSHPMVVQHPESGEKILFVNEGFVTHIDSFARSPRFRTMTEFKTEERALLDYLFSVAKYPEFQMRLKWRPDTVAFWDNRSTQHYAIQDYHPQVRTMHRATIIGSEPIPAL